MTYNDIKTTCGSSNLCEPQVFTARKGGSDYEYTTSQDFSLLVVAKFSREFKVLIGY